MANPIRRVRMLKPTYIAGVVADVGTEQKLTAAIASEFVGNGRAVYLDPQHNDVQSPPGASGSPGLAGATPTNTKSYA